MNQHHKGTRHHSQSPQTGRVSQERWENYDQGHDHSVEPYGSPQRYADTYGTQSEYRGNQGAYGNDRQAQYGDSQVGGPYRGHDNGYPDDRAAHGWRPDATRPDYGGNPYPAYPGQYGGQYGSRQDHEPGYARQFYGAEYEGRQSGPVAYGERHFGQQDQPHGGQRHPGWNDYDQQHQAIDDPDYHQWRGEQIRTLDEDYRQWRQERYGKFSSDFDQWRSERKRATTDTADTTPGNESKPAAGKSR